MAKPQQSIRCLQKKVMSATTKSLSDSLLSKISPLGNPEVSIIPELDLWVSTGRELPHSRLRFIIKHLRFRRRFNHALQVSNWMGERDPGKLTCHDTATRMNLILRVHGLAQAEAYFNSLPAPSRTCHVYIALLTCYTHITDVEKAEAVMAELTSRVGPHVPLPYNILLTLYYRLSLWDRLDALVRTMRLRSVPFDRYALGVLMGAHAARADPAGLERTISEVEAGPTADANTYAVAADCLFKTGMRERGLEMLDRSLCGAHLVRAKDSLYASLLKLCGDSGDRSELYRIWGVYQRWRKNSAQNKVYRSMIRSLVQVGDLWGAEEVFAEWGRRPCSSYDARVAGPLLRVYCWRGYLGKAETLVKRILSRGGRPDFEMWTSLAAAYAAFDRGEEAVAALKEAIKAGSERDEAELCRLLGGEEAVRLLRSVRVFSESSAEGLVGRLKNRNNILTHVLSIADLEPRL